MNLQELKPSNVIIDIYNVIQDHPEAGKWAIEFRFYPYPTSEWVLLNDIEDKAKEIDKIIIKMNVMGKKDAYISMAIHEFEKVKEKLQKAQELENEKAQKEGRKARRLTLRNVQGDSGSTLLRTVSDYTLALVVDVDVNEIHNSKTVESEEKALELSQKAWEALKPKLQELGIIPRWVLFTGGGIQLWFVGSELEKIQVIDRAAEIIPPVFNALLPEGYSVDNIYDHARIVRAPLTINYKYKTSEENPKRLEIRGRVLEFNDVRVSLTELLDTFEAYAKEHNIQLGTPRKRKYFATTSRRYEITNKDFEALAQRLVEELAPWFKRVKDKGSSRHELTNAIAAYIVRNTNLTLEDMIGNKEKQTKGIWDLVFDELVKRGIEDPGDYINRIRTIEDVYEKYAKGTPLGTRAYLMKKCNFSEEEAIEILRAVKRALFPYLKPIDVKRLSKFDAKPYDADEAPKDWSEVDEDRKKATGIWYLEELVLETANYIYFEELRSPGVFFITEKIKINVEKDGKTVGKRKIEMRFNDTLYRSFLSYLGVKKGEPIEREQLWNLLLEKFEIKDYELRAIYFRKILHLLTPEGMRRPRCIEEFIRELAEDGELPEDKIKHLAKWIKFYAKPLRHSPTSILLRAQGIKIDMREAIWAKAVEFFADDDETAQELIKTFREAYEQAEPPFPCFGVKSCPFFPDHKGCPFIAPKRREILAVSLVDVQIHGSDGIVIIVGSDEGTKEFIHKGKIQWIKDTKNTIKYPTAEWFLDVYAKEFLGLPEALHWDPEIVTELLKSRARVVKSQLNEFDEWFEHFIDWLRSENAKGLLLYEKADISHIFIKGNMIGIPPGLAEDFYRQELNIGGKKFKEMLMKELGNYYLGKRQVKLYNTYNKEKAPRNCYFISLDWFKKTIGEPNIIETESEGDVSKKGFTFEEGEA